MESELLWLLTENPHIFLSGHLVTILGGVLKSLPGAMEEKVFSGAAGKWNPNSGQESRCSSS